MEALTYSTVAVTLGLVVTRPRIGPRLRITPAGAALAGVAVLAACGSVRFSDLAWAAATMWRPLLGIVAIMVMTGVARRVGVLEGLADIVFARARGSASRLFTLVFAFGAITAAALNNDSAVLLLTPLVLDAAKKRAPSLAVPLAFAVFLSAGIAPVMVSNPMNMVVASTVGIGFNEYAARMALPALAGCLVTFAVIRMLFDRDVRSATLVLPSSQVRTLEPAQRRVLVALAAIIVAYPVVSYVGGPVWAVAACGALLLLVLAARAGHAPTSLLRTEVHLDVLLFLVAVLVLSLGLRNVGVVDRLSSAYTGATPARIGVISALGSAVLNNHPMANLNMLALGNAGGAGDHSSVLAALVGGDLGPRLFPMGSLAGLLWLEMLRRSGVDVGVRKFLIVGALATLPTLAVALALL